MLNSRKCVAICYYPDKKSRRAHSPTHTQYICCLRSTHSQTRSKGSVWNQKGDGEENIHIYIYVCVLYGVRGRTRQMLPKKEKKKKPHISLAYEQPLQLALLIIPICQMEHSREKSNIPRPSTFNISSQDGRRVDWEIKQEDFQRETRWLWSTPAAIVRSWWKLDRNSCVRLFYHLALNAEKYPLAGRRPRK